MHRTPGRSIGMSGGEAGDPFLPLYRLICASRSAGGRRAASRAKSTCFLFVDQAGHQKIIRIEACLLSAECRGIAEYYTIRFAVLLEICDVVVIYIGLLLLVTSGIG